jgi:hypothetical protein
MVKYFKNHCFILIGILIICQISFAQTENFNDPVNLETEPIISGVHTLSVHVRDSISHDSVYQFFVYKLMLPIYYTPVKYGQVRYAGIYAGNMVLEPCGPYQNIVYAKDSFRAIFYGMNFEVYKSLTSSDIALNNRGIRHQVNQGSIYIRDSILCNQNVFSALYEVNDKEIRDSLQKVMNTAVKNKPGIEYIKEIFIGYKEKVNLKKWKEFLYPLEFDKYDVCQINDSLQIYFTRGNINEVKGITFKVKSLIKAEQYLVENKFLITESDKKIKLNQTQSFGLSIYFTDEK